MFEDFLKDKHAEDYHGTDDDMPDAYETWLESRDIDVLIAYADMAIIKGEMRGLERGKELALKALASLK